MKSSSQQLNPRKYFSVIIGEGCNAKCPFCIAPDKMKHSQPLNPDHLHRISHLAKQLGGEVSSVSGGGEPLLLERKSPELWQSVNQSLSIYPKRDLHSNYSIKPLSDIAENFTHLTVSIWPTEKISEKYFGRNLHQRIIDNLLSRPDNIPLRLSAVLGRDWCLNIDDVLDYVKLAKRVGANQVTLREVQPSADNSNWLDDKFLSGSTVEQWLSEDYSAISHGPRQSPVFDVDGVEVCVYRYAGQELDQDFYYYRPSIVNGEYGFYTDYLEETSLIDINEVN